MKRELTTQAPTQARPLADAERCNAMCESVIELGACFEAGSVSRAIQYFDRLVEPRIVAADDLTATISHVQSGLGNRAYRMFGFTWKGEADSFVDQIAQRAIEGRGWRC